METCPHYLTLAAEGVPDGATAFKCCPPIRDLSNQDVLWAALATGDIDLVVTDHSPSTADLKVADFARAWGGISSLQIGLPVVWTAARERGLTLGAVHPMRFRRERAPIIERIGRGEERVSHVQGRFFIHRLQNVGATGLQRSWTDNLLWHHTTHLVDFGLWMLSGGDLATVEKRIQAVSSCYPPLDERTGIPMELVLTIKTDDDQTIVTTGSYYSREYVYDTFVVTDRDSYRTDERRATLTTGDGEQGVATEQENAELIAPDFVEAVATGREPHVPGWSVLPAMRVLHQVQEQWDARHGKQQVPGRPVV